MNDELKTTIDRINELESKDSLTFVEESELQKLKDSVELLRIQADLAEKDRVREAKESANDTVTAYQKNFKHDITTDAVQGYIETSDISGNHLALFSDENNIPRMLAGIELMERARDELDKNSEYYQEYYQDYQELIDEATDSI